MLIVCGSRDEGLCDGDPCPDLFPGPAVIVVEMHDDLTDEARAPTARAVHVHGERPGPPLTHRAPGLFWGDADREQGRTQGTRSIALEEGSKRLRRHHRPQLNRLTESHRALRQRLR